MARRGWAGSPPADDDEARSRIIEAATRCVDRDGPEQCTLADVATELGVTRQTVYRYFPGTDGLFFAVAQVANESFVDDLTMYLLGIADPADWVVEALATTLEWLPTRPHLTLVLDAGGAAPFTRSFTSRLSMGIGQQLLERSAVDWAAAGYDSNDRDQLVEFMLRIAQSMVMDPPDPPRSAAEIRTFLRRWVAPALE